MLHLIKPSIITNLHKECLVQWESKEIIFSQEDFFHLVEENHAFNYKLWHAEDKARRDDMGFEYVYLAKREIDFCNQQRNNRMEAMDEWLYKKLQPAKATDCIVNSESPGMMIDRLSILSLKSYHMELQTKRLEVSDEHKVRCKQKLAVIHQQLIQLEWCLGQLLDEVQAKTRTFRVYHQFKMYNDPELNPQLYSRI